MLTADTISSNWAELKARVNEYFPTRRDAIYRMMNELEERFVFDPASSYDFFHNAFPGGYVDHVLRVDDNAIRVYNLYKDCGLKVDNFSIEELHFAALHHDLGKVGLPGDGRGHYIPNDSDWHIKNQGKVYKKNDTVYNMNVTDRGFYLLNHYGIRYSINEMIGIRCTDGMFEEANKEYLAGFNLDTKLRNSMPYILHQADIMAFRFEFERWATKTGKFRLDMGYIQPSQHLKVSDTSEKPAGPTAGMLDIFDDMFKI